MPIHFQINNFHIFKSIIINDFNRESIDLQIFAYNNNRLYKRRLFAIK